VLKKSLKVAGTESTCMESTSVSWEIWYELECAAAKQILTKFKTKIIKFIFKNSDYRHVHSGTGHEYSNIAAREPRIWPRLLRIAYVWASIWATTLYGASMSSHANANGPFHSGKLLGAPTSGVDGIHASKSYHTRAATTKLIWPRQQRY